MGDHPSASSGQVTVAPTVGSVSEFIRVYLSYVAARRMLAPLRRAALAAPAQ